MALQTFIPPKAPSIGSGVDFKPRVLRADFGDGYSQRAGDGLNTMPATWNLTWDNLSSTDRDAIAAFLQARGGHEAFLWTGPDDVERAYTCPSWGWRWNKGGLTARLQATFREEFDL